MMALTHAPFDLVIGTSDGVDVRFAGIEVKDAPGGTGIDAGTPAIHLHLNGVRGKETMSRDVRFERERAEWWERRKVEGSDKNEKPPPMPGVPVFEKLTAVVSDDLGTEYQWSGGNVAGGGTEWDARWIFLPSPPQNAQVLRLEFSVDGKLTGKSCELSLS